VSDRGYVWNGSVILRGATDKDGYRYFNLCLKRAHRLVAELFIENPENKPDVNHIDGNKLNNRADNLEWVAPKENVLHAMLLGLKPSMKGSDHYLAKLTEEDIPEIRELLKSRLFSQHQIAKEFNVSNGTISTIQRGKTWAHIK
jgi:HNH endonuclease